jgi:PTS system nitrogen regulatory IIA component
MKKISRYMKPKHVIFLSAESRDDALQKLVHHLYKQGEVEDEQLFLQAIIEREKIVSTGIGMGVAIPHAKLPTFNHFFIAIGILRKPIDWHALDRAPVRIVFMIGGPDDKQTEYLQILSGLTQMIKDEGKRKKLLTLEEPAAIIEIFNGV